MGSSRSTFQPAGGRHLDPLERDGCVPGVPHARLHLDALCRNDDPSSVNPSIATPAAAASASWSTACCPRIRVAELTQGAPEQRSNRVRPRRVELRARRIDQAGVAGLAREQRIHPGEQPSPVLRAPRRVPPLHKREPTDPRPGLLELPLVLRAVLAPARHSRSGGTTGRHRVEHARVERSVALAVSK